MPASSNAPHPHMMPTKPNLASGGEREAGDTVPLVCLSHLSSPTNRHTDFCGGGGTENRKSVQGVPPDRARPTIVPCGRQTLRCSGVWVFFFGGAVLRFNAPSRSVCRGPCCYCCCPVLARLRHSPGTAVDLGRVGDALGTQRVLYARGVLFRATAVSRSAAMLLCCNRYDTQYRNDPG